MTTFAQRYERPAAFTRQTGRASTSPRIGPEAEPNPANAQPRSFPAPVKGLMLDVDIASIPDGGSFLMRNVYPLSDRVRMRGGLEQRNTGAGGEVIAIGVYDAGATRKAFAFTNSSAFDVTSAGAVGAAVLTGLTATVWNFTMMTVSGGTYLVACGAGNDRRLYNGTTWATTPAITGVPINTLAASWVYANRLFFAQTGTTDAWYLPIDSIGGTAVKFPLGGEFQDGGKILTGGTWSTDAGDNPRSMWVAVSDVGDVVIYEGADPASWSKRGNYRVPRPCGVNCLYRSGGDLLIMTEAGLFAMSQIVQTDLAQLMNAAVSKGIRPLWRDAVKASTPPRWQMVRREREGMAIVAPIKAETGALSIFPGNAETGAWAVWDGWKPTAIAVMGDELLVGTADGRVARGEATGADMGLPYTCSTAFPFFDADSRNIHARMARAVVRSVENCDPRMSVLTDYSRSEPIAPPVCVSTGASLWNVAEWNEGIWSGEPTARQPWQAVTGAGSSVAVVVQYTFAQAIQPTAEIMRADLIAEIGGVMT